MARQEVPEPTHGSPEPDVLRSVPRLPSGVVHRERLLGDLDASDVLTVVRGPAGFGKTTLVADWLDQRKRAAEWLTVQPGADPGRVRALLLAAIASVAADPRVVVLDRYEHVQSSELDQWLVDLLHSAPDLHLIVLSRVPTELSSIGPLYVDTTTVSPRTLAFTVDEIERLTTTAGDRPNRLQAAALLDTLGGWPAATRVALEQYLRVGDISRRSLVTMRNSMLLPTYLVDQTMADLDTAHLRDVAMAASIVDEITVDLLHSISPCADPAGSLESLHRRGYTRRCEVDRSSYQLLPALRRALRSTFALNDEVQVHGIETRAASWYRERGRLGLALVHAVRAEDWSLVVDIISDDWLTLAPVRDRDAEPDDGAVVDLSTPDGLEAKRAALRRLAESGELASITLPSTPGDIMALAQTTGAGEVISLLTVHALVRRVSGDIRAAADLTRLAESLAHGVGEKRRGEHRADVRGALALQWATTHFVAGELVAALRTLDDATLRQTTLGNRPLALHATGIAALTLAVAGEPRRAVERLHTASVSFDVDEDGDEVPERLMTPRRAAEVLAATQLLERDAATRAIACLGNVRRQDELWFATALAIGEYALTFGGDYDGGVHQLVELRSAHASSLGEGAFAAPLLATTLANLHLAAGRPNAARTLLSDLDEDDPRVAVVNARLALLSGRPETAFATARRILRRGGVSPRERTALGVIQTLALLRTVSVEEASVALRATLDVSDGTGELHAYATIPRSELAAVACVTPGGAELLARLEAVDAPRIYPECVTLIDLTKRERVVLSALAAGMTLRDIATELFVSANTVKTQTRAIYAKLGVHSRADAVALGYEWGLILPDE
jgi:LuxR family maltose regulon positive regulatory protein